MNAVSTELFTRSNKSLIAEISEVKNHVHVTNSGMENERMVISIRNPQTKNTVTWCCVNVITTPDGDIDRWILEPMVRDVLQYPALIGWKVVLLND